ncbi:MAG: FadR/GntR family transcriptional regulator [Eubacteriales bacterium]
MIQRKNVCDSIVEDVIEKIKNKQLLPGDKLPNEKDMSEEFGVSRISLREALRYLSAKGLIVTRHGEGSLINEYNPNMIAETFYNFSLLTDNPIMEMLEIRKIMESEAARLCATKATEEEIAEIIKYKDKREEYCESNDSNLKFEYDRLFHLSIASACHNEVLHKFIETIHWTIELHQREYTKNQENVAHTTNFHEEIATAIANHDADVAADKMYAHLELIEKSFIPDKEL